MTTADREGLARAIDPHAFVWPATPEHRAQALAKADEFLAPLTADVARLSAEVEGWKRVAAIASVALEPIRMAGTQGLHAPQVVENIDLAVVAIRMALDGHLPPAGTYENATAPARTALAGQDKTEGGQSADPTPQKDRADG